MFAVTITSPLYKGRSPDVPKVTVIVAEPAVRITGQTPLSLCHLNCKVRGLDVFWGDLLVSLAIILSTGTPGLKN